MSLTNCPLTKGFQDNLLLRRHLELQVLEVSPGNHTSQFSFQSAALDCQGAYASLAYYSAKLHGFQQKQ